jgi:hypothetical protein
MEYRATVYGVGKGSQPDYLLHATGSRFATIARNAYDEHMDKTGFQPNKYCPILREDNPIW